MIAKTKEAKNCLENHFSIPSFITKKAEEDKKVDSFEKKPFSKGNKVIKNLKKNRNEEIEVDMEIENKNSIESLKDLQNYELMDIINEEEIQKKTVTLDSLDNYSTNNSNIENDKRQKKQNLIKEKIDYKDDRKIEYSLQISKEMENEKNTDNEYIDEILENLINEEKIINSEINPNYLEYQPEINEKMRTILIDWIIDVNNGFNFKEETLYTAIYIMDSYLSKKIIQRKRLQLLGITSLFIASKLNEIYFRRISDYVFITDNTYTQDEIKHMEDDISKTLNFDFLFPSSLSFFEILSKKYGFYEDLNKYNYGQFLMQTFLMDIRSLNFSYSLISCACCYIIMKFYKNKNYQVCYNSKFYTVKNNYLSSEFNSYIIKDCAKNICSVISKFLNSNLQAIFNKYKNYKFYKDIKSILGNSN